MSWTDDFSDPTYDIHTHGCMCGKDYVVCNDPGCDGNVQPFTAPCCDAEAAKVRAEVEAMEKLEAMNKKDKEAA